MLILLTKSCAPSGTWFLPSLVLLRHHSFRQTPHGHVSSLRPHPYQSNIRVCLAAGWDIVTENALDLDELGP